MMSADQRPVIAHVVYRFDVGGLENGVVNLINHSPPGRFRHVVIALTEVTDFRRRVTSDDVEFVALHKPAGHAISIYPALFRLFRSLAPSIVHTRNLAALEASVPAWAAGVRVRIHGEHGRDVEDYDGRRRKYQWIRRAYRPFVSHYVALSRELAAYLHERVGVPQADITQIYNGVDLTRFAQARARLPVVDGDPFTGQDVWRIGTVGRMQAVKDPLNLVRAFIRARELSPAARDRMRLVMVGDGAMRAEALSMLTASGAAQAAWLAGERDDVPALMASLDCFVLPSRAEGISNTILEAMACGLPVVATDVGGNGELVVQGRTGELVPAQDHEALAQAILRRFDDRATTRAMGEAGRARAESQFGLNVMVQSYCGLYEDLLQARVAPRVAGLPN